MLDTNIAIYARDGAPQVLERIARHRGEILLSALSLAELQRGLVRDPAHAQVRKRRLDILLREIPILPFDAAAAEAYGEIIRHCGWVRGRDFDRMIAGHARSTASILVTNNTADFRDVTDLAMENWAAGIGSRA